MRLYLFLIFIFINMSMSVSQSRFDTIFQAIKENPNNPDDLKNCIDYFTLIIYNDPLQLQIESKKLMDFYTQVNPLNEARVGRWYALSYYFLEEYDQALEILLPLIDVIKEKGNAIDLGHIYSSIALAYRPRGDLEIVEQYSKEAIMLFAEGKDSMLMAATANNLANHYMELDKYLEAEIYFEKAVPFFRKMNNKTALSYALLNRGMMNIRRNENEVGIKDIQESLPLIVELNHELALSAAHTALGNAELNLSNLTVAEQYLKTGYEYATAFDQSQQISITAELLSRVYAAQGKFEPAYNYYKEWGMLRDSFQSDEQDARLVDAIKKYESETKQQEIELLSVKNKVANRNTIAALISLIGISLFAFVTYRNHNRISKMNHVLESQKNEISQSLTEKEFLLKEIHHRVKNNLQVISSLLKLQAKSLDDGKAKQALDDGRVRVRSMSLIHQNLYQKNNLAGIKMDDYIEQLADELIDTYKLNHHLINTNIDVAPIVLDVESVVPMGLIINELITNTLKYAFDKNQKGQLFILLKPKGDSLLLEVSDNGKGYDSATIRKDSFGLSLIEAFADRLGATYVIDSTNGTKATFNITRFKIVQ